MLEPELTRRRFGRGAAATSVTLVAGCLGNDEPARDGETVDAADDGESTTVYPLLLVDPDRYDGDRSARPRGLVIQVHSHESEEFHWHHAPLYVPRGGRVVVRAVFAEDLSGHLPGGDAGQYELDVFLSEDSPEDLLSIEVDDRILTFYGESLGEGGTVFRLLDGDEAVWETSPLPVEVVEDDDVEEENVVV